VNSRVSLRSLAARTQQDIRILRRALLAMNATYGKKFIFKDVARPRSHFWVDIELLHQLDASTDAEPAPTLTDITDRIDDIQDRLLRLEAYFGGAQACSSGAK
jgi:hypothetical protein